MKFLFLINNPPIVLVSEWTEIQKYQVKGYDTPSPELFSFFKALEHNREFEKEITSARRNAGIPEGGFSWEEYCKKYHPRRAMLITGQEKKDVESLSHNIAVEADR